MPVTINGTTGVDLIKDGTVLQADLAPNVAGNGPAFSAYNNSAIQVIPNNTYTKVLFASEDFDTNNNFGASTFSPTVAGYYQINATIHWASSPSAATVAVYKNGSLWKILSQIAGSILSGPTLVACNGTTDYIEIYVSQFSGASSNISGTTLSWFQGYLARSA
jgi:hypothetical protein